MLYNMNMVCLDLAVAYMSIFWRLRYGICPIASPKEWDAGGLFEIDIRSATIRVIRTLLEPETKMRVVGENRYLYYTTILMVLEV